MGLWVERVAVGAGRELAGVDGVEAGYRSGDWEFGNVLGNFSQPMADVVERVAQRLDAPAIGFYVADSDAAAVYFAGPDTPGGWLAINHSYDDSDEAHTWLDPEDHRKAADALAAWSVAYAPRKTTEAEIVASRAGVRRPVGDQRNAEDLEGVAERDHP